MLNLTTPGLRHGFASGYERLFTLSISSADIWIGGPLGKSRNQGSVWFRRVDLIPAGILIGYSFIGALIVLVDILLRTDDFLGAIWYAKSRPFTP